MTRMSLFIQDLNKPREHTAEFLVQAVVKGMVLQLTAKRQLSLPSQKLGELYTFIIRLAVCYIKIILGLYARAIVMPYNARQNMQVFS